MNSQEKSGCKNDARNLELLEKINSFNELESQTHKEYFISIDRLYRNLKNWIL